MIVLALCFVACQAGTLVVINQRSADVQITQPVDRTVAAGKTSKFSIGNDPISFPEGAVLLTEPRVPMDLPSGTQRYAVVVVNSAGATLYDTNDLQVELSAVAGECVTEPPARGSSIPSKCMSKKLWGGVTEKFVKNTFQALWSSLDYWSVCNYVEPAKQVSSKVSNAGSEIQILRESPLVASVRNFVDEEGCKALMNDHAGLSNLVNAHVGSGGGGTSTSESRETLTNNMFINWAQDNILSQTAAKTFDVVSELLGEEVPYEGQEPVNFLHYIKGFEYKPHMDGGGGGKGKRVATTLIYCEAADQGGATVFPQGAAPLRFQPTPGSMLFFEYAPNPGLQTHAACPVIAGNKSTLTQWHRLGVSPQKPWDRYEDWGEYHNPYGQTRWAGPRYGKSKAEL